ncbi:MAG TPA: spiro-SPASM protein [Leptospiraceae bacterium]|nr:spiro-SPASM protein [Leptospiraceae bacterium]
MKITKNFAPSLAAVFLNENQRTVMKKSATENLLKVFRRKLKELFPYICSERKVFSNVDFSSEDFAVTFIQSDTELEFLRKIAPSLPPSVLNDPDIDEVYFAYFEGIFPILEKTLTLELLERHNKYLSQYSYGENTPSGLVPVFISREFLSSLSETWQGRVHDFFLKNINHYDPEIFYKSPDLRQFRLDFTLSDERSFLLSSALAAYNENISYEEILPVLKKNPAFFRSFPSYIEIEINRSCTNRCIFCPRETLSPENDNIRMSAEFLEDLHAGIFHAFPVPAVYCLGGLGEPLLHSEFERIAVYLLRSEYVKELIIETALFSGFERLISVLMTVSEEQKKKICVIVNLSTLQEPAYNDLYRSETGFDEIKSRIIQLKNFLPNPGSLYVQMIKMKEVETETENFFNEWEKREMGIILQKYNRFAGRLAERRVSDLTPVDRDFCWHLARDLYINADCTVALCRQNEKIIIGNLETDSVSEIWQKGEESFRFSLNGEYEKLMSPCTVCDEWYTFNA